MKATILLTTLLGVALAEDQIPLKEKAAGWFDKAKSYIPSVTPGIPNPIHAGAAAIAAANVQQITIKNYKHLLTPKPAGEEEWLVYMTGGNKTCFGRCGKADLVFNESVPLLAALPCPAGTPPLHIAKIDCEVEAVLCNGWAAACPAIWHFDFPRAGLNQPSTLRVVDLNVTSSTPTDIVRLANNAPNSKIADFEVYEGFMHPVDGALAKLGVQEYLGWVIWGMGTTPSWLIMIGISFFSRQFMSKRMTKQRPDLFGPNAGAAPAPGAAAAAPAAKPATPGSAGKGGKKRR